MSAFQRVRSMIVAALMVACGIIMLTVINIGYEIVCLVLCITLLVSGIRHLIYFFRMARHMVGGRMILYKGVILLDLGVFTATIFDIPQIYVMLYLFAGNMVSGGISIFRALETKKLEAPHWRLTLVHGITNIAIAVLCIVFIMNTEMVVFIYALGLFYSAIMRIVSSFRKTAVVYVQ